MDNLLLYNTFDSPIPYKKLNFHPVTVKDYLSFTIYSSCLLVEKNIVRDANIIRMGNLQYLYHLTMNEGEKNPQILLLDRLLSLCLKEEESFSDIKGSLNRYRQEENGKGFFEINGEKYGEDDYLEIRKIIANQNLLDLPNEKISKEVRDSLEKAKQYKDKLSGMKTGSFEDYIVSLAVSTGWSYEYIYGLSIRKFINSIRRLDNLIHYKIYLGASMSGMVEFKDKSFIKHWLTDLTDNDKYSDVSMNLDTAQEKISMKGTK